MENFSRYWSFVGGIRGRNSPHKGQWRGALMFSWIGGRGSRPPPPPPPPPPHTHTHTHTHTLLPHFGGLVCGDPIAGGFPSQKLGLMFNFMFALTSCLTNNKLPVSWNPRTRMRCHSYVSFVNPTFRMVEHQETIMRLVIWNAIAPIMTPL